MNKIKIRGKSPNIFVGHNSYPKVNVGYLLTQKYNHHDDPKFFAINKFSIPDIITKRRQLLNSSINTNIQNHSHKLLESAKLIAKSSNPVDTEITLSNMKGTFITDDVAMPFGASSKLEKIDVTDHIKIEKPIEKLTEDRDVLAKVALKELNKKDIDEYHLTKLLSVGTLGKNPKLVPTKWSITAVDDLIGIDLENNIKEFEEINFQIYNGEYLGNKYIICFLPGAFSFEFVEIMFPFTRANPSNQIKINTDFEFVEGRKEYAFTTAGGYYASRLPILYFLNQIRKQARVIVFRCITHDYNTPLGVWVVREGVRETLKNKLNIEEQNLNEEIKNILKKYNVPNPNDVIKKSILLKEKQENLKKFF